MAPRTRDLKLIDALDGRAGRAFEAVVWRIVREGRDATLCASSGGRWDDGTFDVLYTSLTRECAIAEMDFHVRRGQPIPPSKPKFILYELAVSLDNVLDLSSKEELSRLGLDMSSFGKLSYMSHSGEYPRSQDIAEVAHFLGFDGLLVPSARCRETNLIVFCDCASPAQIEAKSDHGLVVWPNA